MTAMFHAPSAARTIAKSLKESHGGPGTLFVAVLCLGALCLGGVGCASVSVKEQNLLAAKEQPTTLPKKIFIRPFSYVHAGMVTDRRGESLADFKTTFSESFSRQLIKRLEATIA